MTRYAKVNKDNKRVPKEASTWEELKPKDTMAVKGLNVSKNNASLNEGAKGKTPKKKVNQTPGPKSPINKATPNKRSPRTRNQKKNPPVANASTGPVLVETVEVQKVNKGSAIGCYHCQDAGHKLRDCPKVDKSTVESKMCYKCGSMEHVSYMCKVKSNDSYPFATCILCKKVGHIAKQCPTNKKGCYPFGGSCLQCGSIEHYKRDCPQGGGVKRKAKEIEDGVVVDCLDNKLSADAEEVVVPPVTPKAKKQKKTKTPVKF